MDQTISEVTSIDVAGNPTKTTTAIDRAAKKQTTTTDTPDSNLDAVSINVNGLLQSTTATTPQTATTYAYDSLGRQIGVADPRSGSTSRAYNTTTGQLASTNDGAGTTAYEYYPATHLNAGRLKSQTNAANKKTYFGYNSRGELLQSWGDATYPLEYAYDSYGQRTELHTFRGGQNWAASAWPPSTTGTADVTKWIYQESTGLLTQKQDAALKGPTYTYDELGRVKTRVWARGITCTYGYDANTGELLTINYTDSTPDVSFSYDRGGRQTNITDAAGSHTRTFNVAGELQTEQIAGGILDGVGLTLGYDGFLRRNTLQTSHGANTLTSQTYGYDPYSRLQTVTRGGLSATYAFYPARGLLNTTTFNGGTIITRTYDSVGRLGNITTTPAAAAAQSHAYIYNNLHQRTRATREDGSYWSYVYNDRGELVSGKKYWSDNSIVWGAQTEYSYDNLGNPIHAKSGGNELGNLRQSSYATNSSNQYSQRTVPSAIDLTGTADVAAIVSVNGQPAVRKNEYFYRELSGDNSSGPSYPQINIVGARNNFGPAGEDAVTEKGGRMFLPANVESFVYDDDGNLNSDGRWNYTWDAENRLISMEAISGVPPEAKLRIEFAYDHASRRVQKNVHSWNPLTSSYQLLSVTKFVYDGSSLTAELDSNYGPLRTYTWDEGLLWFTDGENSHIVVSDANRNVTALIAANSGTLSGSYEYDPFGITLKSSGEYSSKNPFRFSTEYADQETGLIYYGFRYYNPHTGKWLSRDPMEENGGTNLYAFARNDAINYIDRLGLSRVKLLADAFIPWSWVVIPNPVKAPIPPPLPLPLPPIPVNQLSLHIKGDGRNFAASTGDVGRFKLRNWIDVEILREVHRGRVVQGRQADNQGSAHKVFFAGMHLWTYEKRAPFTHVTDAEATNDCAVKVTMIMSGGVPWDVAGPQPPIDFRYEITLREDVKRRKIKWAVEAEHDGIPAHEFFIESGNRVHSNPRYIPHWFASARPNTMAYPSTGQAIEGTSALGGITHQQKWKKSGEFSSR